MDRISKMLIPLTLLTLLAGAWPAFAQPCEYEDHQAFVQDFITENFRNKPSGTGISWTDVISRLLAQVDSLDLDSGETSTDFTWNIDDQLTFKASVVNEPGLFMPLKEAIGDDAETLASLTDQVSQGDDVRFSLDYNFQSKNSGKLGVWAFSENMAKIPEERAKKDRNIGAYTSAMAKASCDTQAQGYAALVPALTRSLDKEKPITLVANAFYRSRDELVGQNEMGASIKYTYGLEDPGENQDAETLIENAMLASARRLAQTNPSFKNDFDAALQASGQVNMKAVDDALEKAEESLSTDLANRSGITDRRLMIEGKWTRKDDYELTLPAANLTLPEDESLTVTLAYSFRIRGDVAATEDNKNLPIFELNASYEDVDSDAARQSRLIAKAIFSRKLNFMGESTELTAGLVYANKPEFLAEQDVDHELSANLGLTFKVGSRQ